MKNSKLFLKTLSHDWPIYLIGIVPIVVICVFSKFTNDIKSYEQIRIFTYSQPMDASFKNECTKKFANRGILETYVYPYSEENADFQSYIEGYGFESSDIVILPESYFIEGADYYSSLSFHFGNPDYENKYLNLGTEFNPNVIAKNYNSGIYGAYAYLVYELGNDEYNNSFYINKYFSFTKNTVMVIPKKSDNMPSDLKDAENNLSFLAELFLIKKQN